MRDRVLRYLNDTGKITSWEAIRELGCTRLSEYVRQLRERGYHITSQWKKSINRYGEKIKYVEYILESDSNDR